MNHRRIFAAALTASLLAAMACTAGAAPAFDCATATTSREQAVCRDRRLASLDQAMAAAYARALARLEGADVARLRQDQRDFLTAIENGFEHLLPFRGINAGEAALNELLNDARNEDKRRLNAVGELEDGLGKRAHFLRSLDPGRKTLTGKWQNASTTLSVTQDETGYTVSFETSLFGFARYNCDFVTHFVTDGGGLRADTARGWNGEDVRNLYTLQRHGATLELRETAPPDQFDRWVCEHDFPLHKVLFPVGGNE